MGCGVKGEMWVVDEATSEGWCCGGRVCLWGDVRCCGVITDQNLSEIYMTVVANCINGSLFVRKNAVKSLRVSIVNR